MGPKRVNFFLLGPPKTATTWIYRCLSEHPDVFVPDRDYLNFFNIHYSRGLDWYQSYYEDGLSDQVMGDTSQDYFQCEFAPQRIHDYNPQARLICVLRNPIQRAYSHFWHLKSKQRISYDFNEVLEIYDLFKTWIEPGFYSRHLENYLDHFNRDQLLILFFDELQTDPQRFLEKIFSFLNIDTSVQPDIMNKKLNRARFKLDFKGKLYSRWIKTIAWLLNTFNIQEQMQWAKDLSLYQSFKTFMVERKSYEDGMDPSTRQELGKIYEPYIKELESMTGRSLSHWYTKQGSQQDE